MTEKKKRSKPKPRWGHARKKYDCDGCGRIIEVGDLCARFPYSKGVSCKRCALKISGMKFRVKG